MKKIDVLKKYEDYYKPLWEVFFNQIKDVDIENCPEPHLPIYGEYYSTSKYKIVFVGIDAAKGCSMAKYNHEDGYSKIIQDWKEEFDELDYLHWANKWNFWRFIFQFLSKFHNINLAELKSGESDNAKNILKSFVWANAMSIERYDITAKGKEVIYDNWKKVADAGKVFDKAENILKTFKPNILILLNWTMVPDGWFPTEIGEPEIYDPNYLKYYYLKNTNTHLYWTKHPRSLTNIGFDVIIHKILQSIRFKNIFQLFPGQTRFELIEKFKIQMEEIANDLKMKCILEKADEVSGKQLIDGIDYHFFAEDLYNENVGFFFYPQNWKEYRIGFSNGLKDFYYGICRQDWNIGKPIKEIQELTPKLINWNDDTNDKWPKGKYFEPRNWDNNNDVWEEIQDGRMKTKIKEIINDICTDLVGIKL